VVREGCAQAKPEAATNDGAEEGGGEGVAQADQPVQLLSTTWPNGGQDDDDQIGCHLSNHKIGIL